MWVAETLITALVAVLLLLVEHWLPWRMIFKRELPRILAYVLGVLALALPFSALLAYWGEFHALAAFWAVVAAGGLAVMTAYFADWTLGRIVLANELAELMEQAGECKKPRQIEQEER